MSLPEADVDGQEVGLYWVAWVDIDGEPVRAVTLPMNVTFSGTGDADLDSLTYYAIDHTLVDIGAVTHQDGGSDTVTATLRGLPGIDDDLLTALATKANWQGRTVRLWCGEVNGTTATSPVAYYTGYINKLAHSFDPESGSSTVAIEVENYLSILTQPRNRTYQDQAEHDSGDESPARMRSAANGTKGSGIPPGYNYAEGANLL